MTLHIRRAPTALALATALALGLSGCGGSGDDTSDKASSGSDAASQELIKKVNEAMKTTSFHSSGTTTAFADGTQETTWDPAKGLRTVVSGNVSGEMYCKEGVNYLEAGLVVESLKRSGQKADVPASLADSFVYTDTEQECTLLFTIAESGRLTPEKDGEVGGKATRAITVEGNGGSDVYHVAASGTPYILRLDAVRGESKSSTTFEAFGKPTDVTMPPDSKLVALEEFQKQALPSAPPAE
ncbi:hypothetical protein [Streptomyces sp. JJ38]|uniref:hypothetical protein n=1 Tax=Streptomyces sp. JJ38 TaxID=2738128 RepID=UPI001C57E2F6|nr:hypothetical protein [Streptomyces sp. JJ38]MBW1599610.1 hypothetical protein [Streptomyces sp. JJ38]